MIVMLTETGATLSAIVLAAVFAAAAAVKFTSVAETAEEFASLGLGNSRVLPIVVAAAEAIAALALVVRPRLGAVAAAALLVVFTGVVTWALATDRQVSCGCFGPLSREPVSSATIARNAALLAMAVPAGGQDTLVAPDLAATIAITAAALAVAVIAQAALTARVLGRVWTVELAGELHAAPTGAPEPHGPPGSAEQNDTNNTKNMNDTNEPNRRIERISQ